MAEIISNNKKAKGNKRSTRVDLTPMVDLGFLLITFFVFTTNMSKPKAMTMVEPKADGKLRPVPQSGATTFILSGNNKVFYYNGALSENATGSEILETNFEGLRDIIADKKKSTPLGKLMFLIKSTPESTYKNAIDVLDEMTISNIPAGHYAEVEISEKEMKLVD